MPAFRRALLGVVVAVGAIVALPHHAMGAAPVEITPPTRFDNDGQSIYVSSMTAPITAFAGNGPHRADFDGDGIDDIATSYFGNHDFVAPPWTGDGGVAVQYSHVGRTDYVNGVNIGSQGGDFGQSMVTGDFNHDGYDDLVIGVPYESTPTLDAVGGVWILYGSPTGLVATSARHFSQDTPGVPGASEADDFFGLSLAAGDLNGDGYADLAVGAPNEAIGTIQSAGMVNLFYGGSHGITTTGSIGFAENSSGVPGSAKTNDAFGFGLAIGKVNGDKFADLAVGVPNAHISSGYLPVVNGMIDLFRGSSAGLSFSGITDVTATQSSVYQSSGYQVQFYGLGDVLGIGDVNGDGLGDVVAGDGGADVNAAYSGVVVTFTGSTAGISNSRRQYVSAESANVPGTTVFPDHFGATIAVGDVTGDGRADVIVGDPDYGVNGSLKQAGVFWLIPGSKAGLTGTGSQEFSQNSTGVPGVAETGDEFGAAVSILNLDGKNGLDVVVGSPYEYVTGDQQNYPSGSDTTFYSSSGKLVAGTSWSGRSLITPDFFLQNLGNSAAD